MTVAEGPLGNASGTGGPAARVSYDAEYFDDANRETADGNVGTNGGTAWTRPSTPDASGATRLVTATEYGPQGLASLTIDPRGIVNVTFYNLLGETMNTIAAYTDGTPTADTNQTTDFTFDADGDETSQTAVMPSGTPNQTTGWIYGRHHYRRQHPRQQRPAGQGRIPRCHHRRRQHFRFRRCQYDDHNLPAPPPGPGR
jgi:hypothetical protein